MRETEEIDGDEGLPEWGESYVAFESSCKKWNCFLRRGLFREFHVIVCGECLAD